METLRTKADGRMGNRLNIKTTKRKEKGETGRFVLTLRKIGLILTAVSGAILAAPLNLPGLFTGIAAYLGLAGTVATAICQAVTTGENSKNNSASIPQQLLS